MNYKNQAVFMGWSTGKLLSKLASQLVPGGPEKSPASPARWDRNLIWLVVDLPLWKMMDWKSVGMTKISQLNGNIKFMFQTTNQLMFGDPYNTLRPSTVEVIELDVPHVATREGRDWWPL